MSISKARCSRARRVRETRPRTAPVHRMCLRSSGPVVEDPRVEPLQEENEALRKELRSLRALLQEREATIALLQEERRPEEVSVQDVVAADVAEVEPENDAELLVPVTAAAEIEIVAANDEGVESFAEGEVPVVAADSEADSESEEDEVARYLQQLDSDDVRVRYADRFEVWFRMQRLHYEDCEIRPETEAARFWTFMAAERPFLQDLEWIQEDAAPMESEDVPSQAPYEVPSSDFSVDEELYIFGARPEYEYAEAEQDEDNEDSPVYGGISFDSFTRGSKRAHDDDDEGEDENEARSPKRSRC